LKRRIMLALVLLATMVVSTGTLAAPVEEELEALATLQDRMQELRKEMIAIQLEAGAVSRSLARRMIAQMRTSSRDMLTPEQQEALKDLQERFREFRREELRRLVEDGVFTEEQVKRVVTMRRGARDQRQMMELPLRRRLAPRRALPGGMLRRLRIKSHN
jgi:hypothetical protein